MSADPLEIHTRTLHGLRFTVVAQVFSHYVDFNVYEIVGWTEGTTRGVFDVPVWEGGDTLEAADRFLHGYVKWDGCSNWHLDAQDEVMLHGCSREDLQRVGDIMAACWDWASSLLPSWDA